MDLFFFLELWVQAFLCLAVGGTGKEGPEETKLSWLVYEINDYTSSQDQTPQNIPIQPY